MFVWGAEVYFDNASPPQDAWKCMYSGSSGCGSFSIPEGQREINELHIPVGRPVKLVMATEDVIHSFYIPAFRVKQRRCARPLRRNVVHGDQTRNVPPVLRRILWNQHSGMIGWIYAMEPAALRSTG